MVKRKRNLLLAFLAILIFAAVIIPLTIKLVKQRILTQKKAAEVQISSKKGVGGGATLEMLSELNTSWFYNWGYTPGYSQKSGLNNWDSEIWKHFVPMLTTWSSQDTSKIDSQIGEICSKGYCNKGNYYLIGNEPDVSGQGLVPGTTDPVADAVQIQGEITQKILDKDPTAKLIILGLASPSKTDFVANFIQKWKEKWSGTKIANLAEVIKGWHFHTYTFYNYYGVCPTDDSLPRDFKNFVDNKMTAVFGKTIPGQEIWVTEMGSLGHDNLPDPNNKTERDKYLNRMSCLIKVYEVSPVVNRYAWYYLGCGDNFHNYCKDPNSRFNLYSYSPQTNSFSITDLGQKYAILPTKEAPGLSCTGICYGSGNTCQNQACDGRPCTQLDETDVAQARNEGVTNCWPGTYRCCTGSKPESVVTPTPKPQPTEAPPPGLSCTGGCYSSSANCETNCGQPCTQLTASDKMCWPGAYRCCTSPR